MGSESGRAPMDFTLGQNSEKHRKETNRYSYTTYPGMLINAQFSEVPLTTFLKHILKRRGGLDFYIPERLFP